MNAYERYTGMLEGRAVDFPPRVPILMQYAAEYIGSNYAAFASDHRTLVEANIRCAEDFGMDQLSCISDPFRETQGFGGTVTYQEHACPRSTRPLADTKDLAALADPDPQTSERMRDRVDAARLFTERGGGEYSILGWIEGPAAEAGDLRGESNFMMDLVLDPPFAEELMDRCIAVGIAFARAQVAAGADTVGIGDALCSQVSPDVYESLIQPREKILFEAVREMGAYVKVHICGDIHHLLDGLSALPIDVLDVDHMVDVETVREKMGTKTAIAGNIDPSEDVLRGTPEKIRESLRRIYDLVGDPYMPMAGCEIPSGTPVENLRALCEPLG